MCFSSITSLDNGKSVEFSARSSYRNQITFTFGTKLIMTIVLWFFFRGVSKVEDR